VSFDWYMINYVHNFSSPFHPQIYGQTKRIHGILEDVLVNMVVLLKMIGINLPMVEFAYNNA
jgi:hypothetical protein